MKLWEKVLAAKKAAQAEHPAPAGHTAESEEGQMEIFIAMVKAAMGHDDHDSKKHK